MAFSIETAITMFSSVTATVAGLATTYAFFWALLRWTQDASEPPTVENLIPFLSPIIGMIRKGSAFHNHLRDQVQAAHLHAKAAGISPVHHQRHISHSRLAATSSNAVHLPHHGQGLFALYGC